MRLNFLAAMALILAIAAPAAAQEWIEFTSREDGFMATFPGQPKVTQTTFRSQFGADLPARVYSGETGRTRVSLTVVDYRPIEKILTAKSKSCPAGAEACSGNTAATSSTGAGYWKADVAGAVIYATWQFIQRGGKVTHLLWNNIDFVEGHQLQVTNADQSRTLAAIYMHENKLYILDATVPAGYPEPGIFQQSLVWLDDKGMPFRYESLYHHGFPAPGRRAP